MYKKLVIALKIVAWMLCALLIVAGITDLKNLWFCIVIGVVGGVLIFKIPNEKKPSQAKENNKKPNKGQVKKIEQQAKRIEKKYDFYVKGTHYEQCYGKTGQEILAVVPLRDMKDHGDKPYGGYTKKEREEYGIYESEIYEGQIFFADVEETEFNSKYAVKVFLITDAGRFQIGWIAERDLELFRDVYLKKNSMWLEIAGGKTKDIDGNIEERDYEARLYVSVVTYE